MYSPAVSYTQDLIMFNMAAISCDWLTASTNQKAALGYRPGQDIKHRNLRNQLMVINTVSYHHAKP